MKRNLKAKTVKNMALALSIVMAGSSLPVSTFAEANSYNVEISESQPTQEESGVDEQVKVTKIIEILDLDNFYTPIYVEYEVTSQTTVALTAITTSFPIIYEDVENLDVILGESGYENRIGSNGDSFTFNTVTYDNNKTAQITQVGNGKSPVIDIELIDFMKSKTITFGNAFEIANSSFMNLNASINLFFPSVLKIGDDAFNSASNLSLFFTNTIGNNDNGKRLIHIGDRAFANSNVIPFGNKLYLDNVQTIGEGAFENAFKNINPQKITIDLSNSSSLVAIEANALQGANITSASTVKLSNNLEYVGANAFTIAGYTSDPLKVKGSFDLTDLEVTADSFKGVVLDGLSITVGATNLIDEKLVEIIKGVTSNYRNNYFIVDLNLKTNNSEVYKELNKIKLNLSSYASRVKIESTIPSFSDTNTFTDQFGNEYQKLTSTTDSETSTLALVGIGTNADSEKAYVSLGTENTFDAITFNNGETELQVQITELGDGQSSVIPSQDLEELFVLYGIEDEPKSYVFPNVNTVKAKAFESVYNVDLVFGASEITFEPNAFEDASEVTLNISNCELSEDSLSELIAAIENVFGPVYITVKEEYNAPLVEKIKEKIETNYLLNGKFTVNGDFVILTKALTIDANGGQFEDSSSSKTLNIAKDATVIKAEVETPTKDGYIFTGWFIQENEEPADTDPEFEFTKTQISDNMTIYAKWEKA